MKLGRPIIPYNIKNNNKSPLLLLGNGSNGLHHFSPAEIEVSQILLEMATLIYECSNQNMKHGKSQDQAELSMVHDHGRRHHRTADVDVINTNRVVFDIIPDLNVPLSLEEEESAAVEQGKTLN
ncbi:hypothetical protein PRUPE_3G204500 [Prunus persica]|uniref:Uncharacterized protein n=1 Tax=Prunus persica TaxID=3760 RepID=A0A251Q3C4_PRUPE|nr:hypothetical protein PRUPE_3G204500 [Prunus persica]